MYARIVSRSTILAAAEDKREVSRDRSNVIVIATSCPASHLQWITTCVLTLLTFFACTLSNPLSRMAIGEVLPAICVIAALYFAVRWFMSPSE